MSNFVHLHVHTNYSLLDGAAPIDELIMRAKQLGMTHLAMTDHGVMYGTVEFYQAAKAAGLTPIIGCEVYIAPNSMGDKQGRVDREFSHFVLLAKDQKGYENLIRLVSMGWIEGYYYRPRIDYATLQQHSEGLIGLSACLSGDIPRLILQQQYEAAKALALRLQALFGEGNFYLEMQDHGLPEQKTVNEALRRISEETGIGLVVTNDVHFLNREDAQVQDVLLCIQTGKFVDDTVRMRMDSDQMYLKSEQEMRALFPQDEEAFSNTVDIARRCNVELELNAHHLPAFPTDEPDKKALLTRIAQVGFDRLYGENAAVHERLLSEIDMIDTMGYVDYFLIVWDFIRFAKQQGIAVGPGRGSAAGSVAAYCLGITGIDPIEYGLIFERFLNPERISMPDIDIDFCALRRQEVIDYVLAKYGADHVCQIITFGTLKARAAVKDVGRVLRVPFADVNRITKLIPGELGMTLDKAIMISAPLRAAMEENEAIAQMMDMARKLEGTPRNAGTHAAGVVISAKPLMDILPLQKNDDTVTTQFPMGAVEELGLLKMDFLGLRNLTIIQDACLLVEQSTGQPVDLEALPLDDEAVFRMISQGDTDGVFQLESAGMRNLLRELKPNCFEDIIACISLYRPGPMEEIPKYVRGKHNPSSVKVLHEKLHPILDVTYGCMVYQEQVMQIVRDLAGYSWARSDLVRRAMSKKKSDVMEQERAAFIYGSEDGSVPGAVKNGVSVQVANQLFDQMMDFASYAFNKSHAAAYALVAYQTAWLKAHYPVETMAALMNSCLGNTDKIAQYIAYCQKRGIKALPPDVNHSGKQFMVENGCIRFGLCAVKNVGDKAMELVMEERKQGEYKDFFDFLRRVPAEALNKRMVESMIAAGCFDSMGHMRAALNAVSDKAIDEIQHQHRRNVQGQISLFDLGAVPSHATAMELPDVREYDAPVRLQMEKEVTGVYITGHPLSDYADVMATMPNSIKDIKGSALSDDGQDEDLRAAALEMDGEEVVLMGIIIERRTRTTRQNTLMAHYVLEDLEGTVALMAFPRTLESYDGVLQTDSIVVIKGRVSIREEENEPTVIIEEALRYDAHDARLQVILRGNGKHRGRSMAQNRGERTVQQPPLTPPQTKAGDWQQDLEPPPPPPAYQPPYEEREALAPSPVRPAAREGESAVRTQAQQAKQTLWLRLKSFDNEFMMGGLLALLGQYPGMMAVKAYALDQQKSLRLHASIADDAALLEQLTTYLGAENVKVTGNE